MNQTVEYIKELTAIASPTGFTREITNYLVETLEKLGYQPIRTFTRKTCRRCNSS